MGFGKVLRAGNRPGNEGGAELRVLERRDGRGGKVGGRDGGGGEVGGRDDGG